MSAFDENRSLKDRDSAKYQRIMKFKKLNNSQLNEIISEINTIIEQREKELDNKLFTALIDSGHKHLEILAEAFFHYKYNRSPRFNLTARGRSEELAYTVAALYKIYYYTGIRHMAHLPDLEVKLLKELQKRFTDSDITNYIWENTHYDECDNGRFFRRS